MTIADVKLADVTPIAVTLELDREPMSFFFVRIETDSGLVGYGESCDSYGCSYAGVLAAVVNDAFAPLLIGEPQTDSDHGPNSSQLPRIKSATSGPLL